MMKDKNLNLMVGNLNFNDKKLDLKFGGRPQILFCYFEFLMKLLLNKILMVFFFNFCPVIERRPQTKTPLNLQNF